MVKSIMPLCEGFTVICDCPLELMNGCGTSNALMS